MPISQRAYALAVEISAVRIREHKEPTDADLAEFVAALDEGTHPGRVSAPAVRDPLLDADSFASVYRGQYLAYVKEVMPGHRSAASRRRYVAAWQDGASIQSIAAAQRFSPYLIARLLLEELCGTHGRREVSGLVRAPALIGDPRLRREVVAAIAADTHVSPRIDRLRAAIGDAHEALLYAELRARGIPFTTEAGLRGIGASKTPDVLLDVPIGILSSDGVTPRVVHWIDSKASFGDPESHAVNTRQQFAGYVNRSGPGAVIYWYGYVDSIVEATPPGGEGGVALVYITTTVKL